jgi:allantoinase
MTFSNSSRKNMPDCDLILRGGTVVTATGVMQTDVAVADGRIVTLAPQLSGTAREEIIATGLHIFPGIIDAHVHFNEPGRADWEGIETGSRALAAGGGTAFFDMPLNAHPPTLDAESFQLKRAAAEKNSLTDFALWGGLVPENVDRLEELAACGVIGFKAFMSNSGIDDFSRADDTTLREGMKRSAALHLPVAVHAESESMTRALAQERIAANKTSIRDYLDSRPIAAETEAIRRALDLAGETGCALHVVHVSSSAGVRLITEAKARGVNVSCETCPHYLTLTEDDLETLGAVAKCAPPLRSVGEQEKLWGRVLADEVDTVGSDHSPSPPSMKTDANFFKVWGGISGVQHTLPLLLTAAHFQRGAAIPCISNLLSQNVAARFALPKTKGRMETGCDADFALVDLNSEFEVRLEELFYRHKQTPYAGRKLRGRVVRTLLRGQTIFHDGKIVATPAGRLLKPRR